MKSLVIGVVCLLLIGSSIPEGAVLAEQQGQPGPQPQGQPGPPTRGQPGPPPQGQQGPRPQGQPAPPPVRPAPQNQPPNQDLPPDAVNVRLDFAISDTYAGTPAKKTLTMLILSGQVGAIRTENQVLVPNGNGRMAGVQLNVDANVRAFPSGLVRVNVRFEYTPAPAPAAEANARGMSPGSLNESLNLVLRDGKPVVVSQSADPVTERKVTVELTATIVK